MASVRFREGDSLSSSSTLRGGEDGGVRYYLVEDPPSRGSMATASFGIAPPIDVEESDAWLLIGDVVDAAIAEGTARTGAAGFTCTHYDVSRTMR